MVRYGRGNDDDIYFAKEFLARREMSRSLSHYFGMAFI